MEHNSCIIWYDVDREDVIVLKSPIVNIIPSLESYNGTFRNIRVHLNIITISYNLLLLCINNSSQISIPLERLYLYCNGFLTRISTYIYEMGGNCFMERLYIHFFCIYTVVSLPPSDPSSPFNYISLYFT